MIEAVVNRIGDDGAILPLAVVRIHHEENVTENGSAGRYSVQVAVDRGGEVGLHQRQISLFPRKGFNVLSLLRTALNQLDLEELELVNDEVLASDLEWGFAGTVREVQARLH